MLLFGRSRWVHVVRRCAGLYLGKEFPDAYPGLFAAGNGGALAIPAAVAAAPFGDNDAGYAVAGGQPKAQPAPHHHKGLLHRRHCVECQRAYAKAHDGVDVPAPPTLEPGAMIHGPVMAAQVASCPTCQGGAVPSGAIMTADAHAPGYAVVGGPGAMASNDMPGYAVVGGEGGPGADPAPIGVSRSGHAPYGDPRMAAMGPRPGGSAYDPSVVPTSTPPAQVAVADPKNTSPIQGRGTHAGSAEIWCTAARARGQGTSEARRHCVRPTEHQGDGAARHDGLRQGRPLIASPC